MEFMGKNRGFSGKIEVLVGKSGGLGVYGQKLRFSWKNDSFRGFGRKLRF